MYDDRIQQSLDSYSDHVRRNAHLYTAAEIRRRADRRRRNQAVGAAFAAVLIAAAGVGTVLHRSREPSGHYLPAGPTERGGRAGHGVTPSFPTGKPPQPARTSVDAASHPGQSSADAASRPAQTSAGASSHPAQSSADTSFRPAEAPSRTSDVSQLRDFGVDLETSVLIDVTDDGLDRWLQTGAGSLVDFTGTRTAVCT
ncbi:hypothetical protein JIG36_51305 [Actinoplanes sp. LDG1-06]|uniref:Uncharacterized protein n=1 Tax=Paractinoplanes ovalisporus TaxID=2810368 RepID=A0ABS2AVS3_9ACTN|nr:hypothetical protein [Actinoplanes ovalisporus]MBM2623906.1 hypothetical protein [Actinoplanes ovalisporus]